MINGTLHCGYCGHPMSQCPGCDAEHTALMRAVCDAMALMNVPPPVKQVTPPRVKFGGYDVCTKCSMAAEWCACAKQSAPEAPSRDGSAESSLERRARECIGGK